MLKKPVLMIPGPTPVPERVLQAMTRPVINHRGPEYESILQESTLGLRKVFKTNGDVLIYPCSGTGAMEAAVANFIAPDDKVLSLSMGVFGDRFAEIASRYGAKVEKISVEWGKGISPQLLADALAKDEKQEIKAILLTHNETSASVVNDIGALAKAKGSHPALLIVDAVSSLAAIDMRMDEWGVDVVVAGSQKALMLPPGLGFVSVSEKAWQAYDKNPRQKFYWDAKMLKKSLEKWQNPYTPPVSLMFGLRESLKMIEEEGLENIFARHRQMQRAVRGGVSAIGLKLFASEEYASPVVTGVWGPENIEAKKIQKHMRETYGITFAGGQKELMGKIFRIGHLGYICATDIVAALAMLEITLIKLGMNVELGKGVSAAQKVFLEK